MKLIELLLDKLMGMYIDLIKDNQQIRSVYLGMNEEKKFIVETDSPLPVGESVTLRLSISGWNLNMPCVVEKVEGEKAILKPLGKVKIKEKRREKRVPTVKRCEIEGIKSTLLDVSYHGMRILNLYDFDMEKEVTVKLGDKSLKGIVRWKKSEEADLKSVGVLIDEPPEWWIGMVKDEIKKYIKALRRL